jgi:hypothetical protein
MYKYIGPLLIAIAIALGGDVSTAQDLGLGLGIDGIRGKGAGTAAPTAFLLLEGGGFILLESGGRIICEFAC